MLETFLTFGGVEIVNRARLRGYLLSKPCPWGAFVGEDQCESLGAVLGEAFVYDNIAQAPWYDPAMPESARVYGYDIVSVSRIGDTNRTVSSVEGLYSGQLFTDMKKLGREMRVEVEIFAEDSEALEYGRAWLAGVLDGSICGQDEDCGTATVGWFADCPPPLADEEPETVTQWLADVASLRREMLEAVCTSGPTVTETNERSDIWAQRVEFTLGSELVGVYTPSDAAELTLSSGPSPVLDVFRNQVNNGRVLGASAAVEVGRNLVSNPSIDIDTSGWEAILYSPAVAPVLSRQMKPAWFGGLGSYALRALQLTGTAPSRTYRVGVRMTTAARPTVTPGARLRVLMDLGGFVFAADGVTYRKARIQWIVRWEDAAGATISTTGVETSLQATAGTLSLRVDQWLTVPATATRARLEAIIRDEVLAVPGGQIQLWMDRLALISGPLAQYKASEAFPNTFPVGFNGAQGAFIFSWVGTPDASQTIIQMQPPTLWENSPSVAIGRHAQIPNVLAVFQENAVENDFAGAIATGITPGATYYPQLSFISPILLFAATPLRAEVQWQNAAGAAIGAPIEFARTVATQPNVPINLQGSGLVAPAGAARARVGFARAHSAAQVTHFVYMSKIGLQLGAPRAFFDGDDLDTAAEIFSWTGATQASPSIAEPNTTGVVPDPLADPNCPPAPLPPQPPVIEDDCSTTVTEWTRRYFSMSRGDVPEVLNLVPAFTISSTVALDAMRIWLIPNPGELPPNALATSDAAAYWEITYLPPNVPLTLDALMQRATALAAGEVRSADHLVLGQAGVPVTYPRLSCGQGYVLVVDVEYKPIDPLPAPIVSAQTRREYL